jgi:hypothetical protein
MPQCKQCRFSALCMPYGLCRTAEILYIRWMEASDRNLAICYDAPLGGITDRFADAAQRAFDFAMLQLPVGCAWQVTLAIHRNLPSGPCRIRVERRQHCSEE